MLWEGEVMHVVKATPVKSPHHIHNVVERHCTVKGSCLRDKVTQGRHGHPAVSVVVVDEHIVEALLFDIDTPKYDHLVLNDNR